MIYTEWMSYIKDEIPLTQVVIPGAHNAGSYGMGKLAQCQRHGLRTQFEYGVRQFCLRLNTDRKGNIVLAHGITKGDLFENALRELQEVLEQYPTEILLLDVREYYPQKFGPVTLTYKADKQKVDALLEKYLNPAENAYCDFSHIKEVTLGDIRKAGKRFILINDNEEYRFSKNCAQILPWEKQVNGAKAENFTAETLRFFDDYQTDGLYWFQTQQTPNLGTAVGVTAPEKLDRDLRKYFTRLTDGILQTPRYLSRANIIAGDFMTEDYMKSEAILRLNLAKGNVKAELQDAFSEGLQWN